MLAPFLITLPADAAIRSATTRSTIIGTLPYFTVDNGVTKSADPSILHAITLSDGRTFNRENNQSTPTDPIELPDETKTAADIEMFIPTDRTTISLNELIAAPNNYWGDDEGDGVTGIAVTNGDLTLAIYDSNNNVIKRNDDLDVCEDYYRVTLSSKGGHLQTEYGYPNSRYFIPYTTNYYIRPKPLSKPYVCYAKPNLIPNGSTRPVIPQIDGPASQWDKKKGFKPQDINIPSSNFPTMGAHGLYFELTIAGDIWQNVSYDKSPSNSGVDITIDRDSDNRINRVRITLTGPRYNTNNATTATPTTFTIYSDREKTNKIYSFTIGKWFIATPGEGNGFNANYCVERYGSSYHIPTIVEYTNANGYDWTGGLAGQPNNYQRRIGGGLLAEWGNLGSPKDFTDGYYKDLDFDGNATLWVINPSSSYPRRGVSENAGEITMPDGIMRSYRRSCVTP